ncbi:MAG: sugar phosphate isomerase/epimerase [Acidobacteria bacterium]|nr:sugar phosphate isomerase/epimerase [Acidobacteriota bacterium]
MIFTRRQFNQLALTALPASGLVLPTFAKPNSKFGGVQIGIIAPYSFRGMPSSADDLLKYLVQLGINVVEMQAEPLEAAAGAPSFGRGPGGPPMGPPPGGAPGGRAPGAGGPPAGGRPPMSPEQQAAMQKRAEDMRKWRLSVSMDKYKAIRKQYDDAGVTIHIVKFGLNSSMPAEEIDYCFNVAKALGCKAITCEPPLSQTKMLGEFAAKHQIMLGYHGHANMESPEAFAKPSSWETAMAHSKFNGCNIDVGHFTAGNGFSPAEFIKKYHDRITNLHLKDRKVNQGPNLPWGQGDTQIKQILQLMRKEKYKFPACIELEYPVPEGSTVLAELAKCVEYCKEALA